MGYLDNDGLTKVWGKMKNYVGNVQIVGVYSWALNSPSLASNKSGKVTGTFTAIDGATDYIVIPRMTGWHNISGLSVNGTTVSVDVINTSSGTHSATLGFYIVGYKQY